MPARLCRAASPSDRLIVAHRDLIIALAAQHRLPAVYVQRLPLFTAGERGAFSTGRWTCAPPQSCLGSPLRSPGRASPSSRTIQLARRPAFQFCLDLLSEIIERVAF